MTARITPLKRQVAIHRKRILSREAATAGQIAAHFQAVMRHLKPAQLALLAAIADEQRRLADAQAQAEADANDDEEEAPLTPPTVSPTWLKQSGQWQRYERILIPALAAFALYSRLQITEGQRLAVNAGVGDAQALVTQAVAPIVARLSTLSSASLSVSIAPHKPPTAALEALIGRSRAADKPLAKLLDSLGPYTAEKTLGALQAALAGGAHPSVAARVIANTTEMSYRRALTISRTELITAYRTSAVDTFRANSDVLDGWIWQAAADACSFCQSMDGTFHTLDDYLDSHPNCFPAGTMVSGPRPIGSTTRWYVGEVIEIDTTGGHHLTVTPNHPILTPHGWVVAGKLVEGGYVVSRRREQLRHAPPISNPDDNDVDAPIEQVAISLRGACAMPAVRMPTAAEDFHGDGIGSQVHVVRANSLLRRHSDTALLQPLAQQHLCGRHAQLTALTSGGALLSSLNRVFVTATGDMSSGSIGAALLRGAAGLQDSVGFGLPSTGRFSLAKNTGDNSAAYPVPSAESILRFAGQVAPDQIISVNRRAFSGHVYNLQTAEQWYIANNIIAHNCRCVPRPHTKSLSELLSRFAA